MKRSTIKERRELWSSLSTKFEEWMKLDDQKLFELVKEFFPAVSEATREECLKMLVMDHTENMIQ